MVKYLTELFTEVRNDLVFAENRRVFSPNVNPDVPFPTNLTVLDSGAITSYANDQRIETNSQYIERIEEYEGGGLSHLLMMLMKYYE